MVKLVGVDGDEKSGGDCDWKRVCLARRHFPIEVEPNLKMIMAVDDSCLGCTSGVMEEKSLIKETVKTVDDTKLFLKNYNRYQNQLISNHVYCEFLSLSKKEVTESLKATRSEVMSTLSNNVSCVGCRSSVETLYQTLEHSGDKASLEPLTVSPDGLAGVNK